jgi:uncharacterized membrane protein
LPYLVDGAWWLIYVGLGSALIAAVFGLVDYFMIPRGTPAATTARGHVILNAAMFVIFTIDFVWRAGDHLDQDKTRWGQLALSAVAVALLGAACWFGGKLTYHYGVRVTPMDQPGEPPTTETNAIIG